MTSSSKLCLKLDPFVRKNRFNMLRKHFSSPSFIVKNTILDGFPFQSFPRQIYFGI